MNCIIVDDDDASKAVLTQMIKQVDYLTVIKTCSNPLEAMSILKNEDIDLLFLDIEMPGMSGMEMLKALDKRPQVILITSHKEYALDAFDLNVVDYLIKPITLPRFLKALSKIKSDTEEQLSTSRDFFFIKKNSVLNKVPVNDILWIEALGDYITIYTKDERFILHSTLKSLESKLHADKFIRVHRSYIVQIDNIKKVEDTTIFINDNSIPVGALYKENFIKRINTLV
ncbi:MAG TPA: LytTR family DNA-binding domain-containing protein [Bacteroidia bacterium]|nr:LytTR family DNA-binding domain-containing protein [Bacteroidia bacterium]